MSKTAAERDAHAEKMSKMASAFSTPAKPEDVELSRRWSHAETLMCQAMALAALRTRDAEALAAAIKMFAGLPLDVGADNLFTRSEYGPSLAWAAAQSEDCFGLEPILAALGKEALDRESRRELTHVSGLGDALGRWLRRGLIGCGESSLGEASVDVRYAPTQAVEMSSRRASPVAACFSADNPVALGIVLGDADRFEALGSIEPAGRLAPGPKAADNEEFAAEAEAQDAWVEKTLLWHAVSCGAWRCAALLASIPEFGAAALTPKFLGFGFAQSYQEQERHEEMLRGAALDASGRFANVFLKMVSVAEEFKERGRWEERCESWLIMAEAAIRSAPAEAKSWRSKKGVGLAEMFLGGQSPRGRKAYESGWGEREDQSAAAGLRLLAAFEEAGFDVDWEMLAPLCEDIPSLARQVRIRGAVAKEEAALAEAAGSPRQKPPRASGLRI